ncbi:MAG: ABC transporter ATP-binding protein/permease [Clostridiales bacterium]|jgi:putative ABC transport system permease protein|nr:ABC transporter ATP-binding protein/permease [Clostridiales bacterium]
MLQIKNISKQYITGELVQNALNDVSLNLRDNEFVAVLGPSGSGKTTLLNVIGGLDRYDSGNMIINGISTKKYTDRDWDSFRNHTIGFVFQSYNLISHQSILANVELALTISGISILERRRRAKEALTKVGLGDQLHKRPNQLSGGQMQRVAIARALVNNPDILLADEPTGALDSETSVQVMELIKEIAKERLVIMVTHNAELAEKYANRIVKLRDGKVIDDSNPFIVDEAELKEPEHKNMGKASMSFFTALSLSFNNLRTKKGRTVLTSFAGSIGIIGIALILSLSTGVKNYIDKIQKDTMVSYPITIEAQTFDFASIMATGREHMTGERDHELDGIYSNSFDLEMASKSTSSIKRNNLSPLKEYLDNKDNEIHQYIGENGIVYSYNVSFDTYAYDPNGELINTNGSEFNKTGQYGMGGEMSMGMGIPMTSSNFTELLPGSGDLLISPAVTENYEILYGSWPKEYNELVLVLDKNNEISLSALYELGILPASEYKEILEKIKSGEEIEFESYNWSYEELYDKRFYMVTASDYYLESEDGLFKYIGDDKDELTELLDNATELRIVGIIRPIEGATYTSIFRHVGYTKALTDYIIEKTNNSNVIKAQEANPDINVLNGMKFEPKDDKAKVEDTVKYLSGLGISEKANIGKDMIKLMYANNPENAEAMLSLGEAEMAALLDEFLQEPDDNAMLAMYNLYISTGSYEENMSNFGYVSLDVPSSISLYADNFEDKEAITNEIDNYNKNTSVENQITYTDYVGLLMSSVTTIVNVISYVLIAFVAVSLVVSSIMIGIITFISVLERTKEIGILRAIGASKRNISQVFNAETFIVGLFAGLIGIGVTLLLLIPINSIIHTLADTTDISASLSVLSALILVGLSIILTLIAGLIPSRKAAKKDPVEALRTE